MAINPLQYNTWFKTERHNSTNPMCRIYEKQTEQMINIYGSTLFYFPISEYDLDGIAKLWGEDVNKKYLEKYTLKGTTDGENDTFKFNSFGVDKTSAERVVFISRKAFTEITGREEPLEGDMFQWAQNKIIYEVIEVTDQENIVLGKELTWRLAASPRLVEGETFGNDLCDSTREDVDDYTEAERNALACDDQSTPIGDGNVVEDPLNVHIPGPSPHKIDDEQIVDQEKSDIFTRNSWGNWE
jgi:hypothetical protein